MIDVLGKTYIIEHCISDIKRRREDDRYREYIAETSRAISINLAILARGPYTSVEYGEYIHGRSKSSQTEDHKQPDGYATTAIRNKLK